MANPIANLAGTNRTAGTATPLDVAIVDASGAHITSFSGGGGGGGGAVTVADGADVVLGTTTDVAVAGDNSGTLKAGQRYQNKLLADVWDSTNHVLKISVASVPSHAVTNAGTFAVQAAEADGANVTLGAKADAKSTATDTTAVTAMSVLKQISASVQAPPSQAVTNAGTFAVQETKSGFTNATWTATHVPAANTQATATKASAGGGVKNICTGFTVSLVATATAPTAVQLSVAVIDGATGGGTYLWRSVISLPATAGAMTAIVRGGLWLAGTAATALTIEFNAAGGANTVESVTMEGTTA